jgi:hypothetical protein
MSKYAFERLGPDKFEELSQSLLEHLFRIAGGLIQFGDGKDGAREATWTQQPSHPHYHRPSNANADISKEWVFQAKFHDLGSRGWSGARSAVESDLDKELDKLVNKYHVPCHKYIMITNVPFSGVRNVGTRDVVEKLVSKWRHHVPEIEVWDAVDLSRMLDADKDVRAAFLETVLPGDVLYSFLAHLDFAADRRKSAFYAYLKSLLGSERDAKAEEAGDESGLPLEKIFVDLRVQLFADTANEIVIPLLKDFTTNQHSHRAGWDEGTRHVPADLTRARASFAFLRASHAYMLLKGGPGVGKSTISQFLTLYHAARIVDPDLASLLAKRLRLTGSIDADQLDAHCRLRFPLRVELRRYAQWIAEPTRRRSDAFLARYLAERVGRASSAEISMDDIFDLVHTNAVLLILDGLDEVSNPVDRRMIFDELATFLNRCEGESSDIQILLSSRPQGYRGEFDGFAPVEWSVVDLDRTDFEDYASRWLLVRIADPDERQEAKRRVDEGMQAVAVQQMATTLLQATVMLTIARRKHQIPHARQKLYQKYVEVIFERERNKKTVRERGSELLRLHELVAYDLLRKMESEDGARTLSAEDFKQCVQRVIEDFGPGDLGGATIGSVVQDIVTQAKDRLCLLAGKGEEQEHVDFVIQPFREYFAAAYLAHHEDADPDRVYTSLVARRHVWGNVLQFYTAFQNQAQQKAWISEADGTTTSPSSCDGLVTMTRARRALLKVLPEFERPRNEYVQRAVRNLFAFPTRWTWLGRSDTGTLLTAFAPTTSFRMLTDMFSPLADNDVATLQAELDLLAQTAGPGDAAWIRQAFDGLQAEEALRTAVLDVAFTHDIQMTLEDCPLEVLGQVLQWRSGASDKRQEQFLKGLTYPQAIDLLFLRYQCPIVWWHGKATDGSSLREVSAFLSMPIPEIVTDVVEASIPPFLKDRKGQLLGVQRSEVAESGARVGAYLGALCAAIEEPDNPKVFQRASDEEALVSGLISDYITVANQLGPPPSEFASVAEWVRWRQLGFVTREVLIDRWLASLSQSDGSWLSVVIHPSAWTELAGFVERECFEHLIKEVQPFVKQLSPATVFPLRVHDVHSASTTRIIDICRCVINVARRHGADSLQNSPLLVDNLLLRGAESIAAPAALKMLEDAKGLRLPSFLSVLVLRLCSTAEGLEVQPMVEFWARHKCEELLWLNNSIVPSERMIVEALEIGSPDAIGLAAYLTSRTGSSTPGYVSPSVASRVTHKLCELIANSSCADLSLKVRLLLKQRPESCQVATWARPEVIDHIRTDVGIVEAVARSLRVLTGGEPTIDFEEARKNLGVFVESHSDFPGAISVAALDAILRIDEITSAPLSDRDWQHDSAIESTAT